MKVKTVFEEKKNLECTECGFKFSREEMQRKFDNRRRCPQCKSTFIKDLNWKNEKPTQKELDDAKKKMDSLGWVMK